MGWSGQCGADAVPPLPSLIAASQRYTSGALPPFGASGPAFDAFWTALNEHWRASPPAEYGTRRWGVPTVCGRRLNLASLYREVCLRGGHEAVGAAKWWKRVGAGLVGVAAAQRATARVASVVAACTAASAAFCACATRRTAAASCLPIARQRALSDG